MCCREHVLAIRIQQAIDWLTAWGKNRSTEESVHLGLADVGEWGMAFDPSELDSLHGWCVWVRVDWPDAFEIECKGPSPAEALAVAIAELQKEEVEDG